MTSSSLFHEFGRARGAFAALLLASGVGCGLDKVEIPEPDGPSGYAISLEAHVTPDVLLADALSLAVVEATVLGPDARPVSGRPVFFQVTDESFNYVDLGTVQSTTTPAAFPAPQVTEATGANGVARVTYRVPERRSVTAIQRVFVLVRLVGDDAQGQTFKSVAIELRPAEVRRFPENPGNTAPNCSFFWEPEVGPRPGGAYPVNLFVRFRTAASDDDGRVVRYFWDFGDRSQTDHPDTQHAWARPGTYTVTHVCTDNNGAQGAFSQDFVVVR